MENNEVLDDESVMEGINLQEVQIEKKTNTKKGATKRVDKEEEPFVNCLRNERIIVRHINKETGIVRDPRHILYGGMAENAVRWFTVPRLASGIFVNVLTKAEKDYLEEVMGLEYNALSIYNKTDNFWENYSVRLTKQDNIFNLSVPDDYIKYKVLLANKDLIAPSMQVLEDRPKATYQFVIVQENEDLAMTSKRVNSTMAAYMEFGKLQDNYDALKTIIETIEGKPIARTSKIEFLQDKVNKIIQSDSKTFIKVAKDPMLPTKILIKKAIDAGLISNRGNMLYLKSDGTPLCNDNEEPTINYAAKYLNMPKHQDLKFSLEAKLKNNGQ